MATSIRQRKYAAAWIVAVAMLAAVIVGVWVMRSSPTSDAAVVPVQAKAAGVEREEVALMRSEPESIQTPDAERSPTPVALPSRDGLPFERETHIAITVSAPDGSPAQANVVVAQFVAGQPGGSPAWKFMSGKSDAEGRIQYELPRDRELFALRAFAHLEDLMSERCETSHEAKLAPPFPKQLALELEPGGKLIMRVFDDSGAPVSDISFDVECDLIWTGSPYLAAHALEEDPVLRAFGSWPSMHRASFSKKATKVVESADAPPWPPQVEGYEGRVDEQGDAVFGALRPGIWRVRVASDPETAKQLPEIRILSDETTRFDLVLGRATDTLAVEGLILDEHGQPLPERCLFVQVADHPTANITSDSLGAFREWSGMGERVTVEPRLEHPSERFDPPRWEGPRGTRGVVFHRVQAGDWVDAKLRVVERSTRVPIAGVLLEYTIPLRSGSYGASRNFDGELQARLPVAEGLSMTVSALGFNVVAFPSTTLRERAAAAGVLEIELESRAVPKPDRFLGDFEGGDSLNSAIERSNAGGH